MWHHIGIVFDRTIYAISVFLDGVKVIENAPLEIKYPALPRPEITLVSSPGAEFLVDDIVVKVWHPAFNLLTKETGNPVFLPVLKERFENYLADEELALGGWLINKIGEDVVKEEPLLNIFDSVSGLKSLRLGSKGGAYYSMSKSIAFPEKYPFAVSDGSFGIRAKKRLKSEVEEEVRQILALRANRAGKPVGAGLKEAIKGQLRDTATISKQTEDKVKATGVVESGLRMQSVGTTGTYYIYSFDGKLMAEYNGLGECVREYIYLGDRLLVEYQPQSNKLYFYTADHINSVRVVTDEMGNRVFAAAYDPYGGIQKVWENSYTPALKFSGKERDAESNLDYFGARYYANFHYRWLSPDPVVNREGAIMNPQLWNLYSFCRNNPVTYWDPDGAVEVTISKFKIHYVSSEVIRQLSHDASKGIFMTSGGFVDPNIKIDPTVERRESGWGLNVKIEIGFEIYIPKEGDVVYRMGKKSGLPSSPDEALRHEMGHVYINLFYIAQIYNEAIAVERINFPKKFLADVAAKSFLGHTMGKMFGPHLMTHIINDLFKLSIK